jgi:hypothetical protein
MPKRRYYRDARELQQELDAARAIRNTPCPVSSLDNQQPLQVLERLVKAWPPQDIRYENSDYESTDNELMKDLVTGLDIQITRRDLSTKTLEYVVQLQDNLAEYERYNAAVTQHNNAWYEQGAPKTVIDPVTGDTHRVLDQYVDRAAIQSSYYPQPKSVYDIAEGPLAKARPSMKRAAYLRVVYQLQVNRIDYKLEYVAYDSKNRIIYYNAVEGPDLAYLVRRSVQEIWGNPVEKGMKGPWLEGIAMLIQGKKLPQCKKDNARPGSMEPDATVKASNPELALAEVTQTALKVSSPLLVYGLPIGLIVMIFVWSLYCLGSNMPGVYLVGMLVLIGTLILSRWLTLQALRKESEIEAEKRFI